MPDGDGWRIGRLHAAGGIIGAHGRAHADATSVLKGLVPGEPAGTHAAPRVDGA